MNSPTKIKVFLIEDLGLMRIVLAEGIRKDPRIEVVGTATNGKEGVEKSLKTRPDVIITDLLMPDYDGVYVVSQVMQYFPTPTILVSSLEKDNPTVFKALEEGAFDFVEKEKIIASAVKQEFPLNDLIKLAAESRTYKKTNSAFVKPNQHTHHFDSSPHYGIIAIGASTGGPSAIESIILHLPENLNIPVVIAQHMPEQFIESFANRLNQMTKLQVKVAEHHEILSVGTIYLCPGHTNTRVTIDSLRRRPMISFTNKVYREFNQPSVDCLFSSIAETYKEKAIGVILTGMGKDGTQGLKAIKMSGGYTIAQDENSSVVYGMPKHAITQDTIKKVVKLKEISGFLVSCL